MGRPKGWKNKYWTAEDKYRIIKPALDLEKSTHAIIGETGWVVSDNLVHKVCKQLNIRSKAKHYSTYKKTGVESIRYPNLIYNHWATIRALEKVVTDTTMIWFKKQRYDWTYYVDIFNGEIIDSDVKPFLYGSNLTNHKLALESMFESKIKRGYGAQDMIIHSDQGSIYSSVALSQVHKDYNIIRSMSRSGTPTDNPIIEAKNGWLKKK